MLDRRTHHYLPVGYVGFEQPLQRNPARVLPFLQRRRSLRLGRRDTHQRTSENGNSVVSDHFERFTKYHSLSIRFALCDKTITYCIGSKLARSRRCADERNPRKRAQPLYAASSLNERELIIAAVQGGKRITAKAACHGEASDSLGGVFGAGPEARSKSPGRSHQLVTAIETGSDPAGIEPMELSAPPVPRAYSDTLPPP